MAEKDEITFRIAVASDLASIVQLLADDDLGRSREVFSNTVATEYSEAFQEIQSDANNEIIVGVRENRVVATLQLTYIPGLTLKGTKRVQIEGVRVLSEFRGQGLGRRLFEYALERAKQRGCKLAQLTTNKVRSDAIRFYKNFGFESSHEGLKLGL